MSSWLLFPPAPPAFAADDPIPDDFPRFIVPGHEKEMDTLRRLYWQHYPGAGPKATLWDDWLVAPALWPAVETGGWNARMRSEWRQTLTSRQIDAEGYVATHQHPSIAHPQGWPFPFWSQGLGGYGWHFSFKDTVGEGWRHKDLSKPEGWDLINVKDLGVNDDGWGFHLSPEATLDSPVPRRDPNNAIEARQSPFIQLRWKAKGLGAASPRLEWITEDDPENKKQTATPKVMYFDPVESDSIVYTMIPVYKNPEWKGQIKKVRIVFGNASEADVTIQALFSTFDTRHNINGSNFIRGCAKYFWWTGDLPFLRSQINRMRLALRYMMKEHKTLEQHVVDVSGWVGHEGRSGLKRDADGKKTILYGEGIGGNYWDLMPFGGKDCYATVQYFDAVNTLAQVEKEIAEHAEWNMPNGPFQFTAEGLGRHAADIKAEGNKIFWSDTTGRFVAAIDADGKKPDYGFTFLNLDAITFGFATDEHAKSIMSWINGDRIVEGDTSQGADIYHWRFAPRATTKRNIDYYGWFWTGPESIPWGGQVQDGGAVLGFSYYDIMARAKVLGPDNAWARLKEILKWYEEVEAAGGYRKYYDGSREGTLQGGGTAGGLGLDQEFFESVKAPQAMMDAFTEFRPAWGVAGQAATLYFDAGRLLPKDWPSLTIENAGAGGVGSILVSREKVETAP